MSEWRPIAEAPPFVTVLVYRAGDLYPVVAHRTSPGGRDWVLEEGGTEDGEHRTYPFLEYEPTHWLPLSALPAPPETDDRT